MKEGDFQLGMSGSSFTRATPSRGGSRTGNSRVKMKRFIERLAFASEKAAHVARACRKETDLFKLLVQVRPLNGNLKLLVFIESKGGFFHIHLLSFS